MADINFSINKIEPVPFESLLQFSTFVIASDYYAFIHNEDGALNYCYVYMKYPEYSLADNEDKDLYGRGIKNIICLSSFEDGLRFTVEPDERVIPVTIKGTLNIGIL